MMARNRTKATQASDAITRLFLPRSVGRLVQYCLLGALLGAVSATAQTNYVDITNTNAVSPFTSWATAATNIQDAVDVALPGATVLVAPGVYETGSRATPGAVLLNRVVITNSIMVASQGGPGGTVIRGLGPLGPDAIRCVYISAGTLDGFTLSNGFTRAAGDGDFALDQAGGGAYAANGTLRDCVVQGNYAVSGGGVYTGTLYNCTLNGNESTGDGGGAYLAFLSHCTLFDNSAGDDGGGATRSTLNNCLVYENDSADDGAGGHQCHLKNSTLTRNVAGGDGGALEDSTADNCILQFNSSPTGTNWFGGVLNYCCTTPDPGGGTGNITAAPDFVSSNDLSLAASSPCIDAGDNVTAAAGTDRAGVPRPLDGDADGTNVVDMGCYEFVHPTADSDGDGMGDQAEGVAGTGLLDPASFLGVQDLTLTGVGTLEFAWPSVTGRAYTVQATTNLVIGTWTNKGGWIVQPGTGADLLFTNEAVNADVMFYRVTVQ